MSCISVVRVGPTHDNICAGMLWNAILDFYAKQQGTDAVPSNDTFCVTNKYFDAQILLRGIESNSTVDNDQTTANNDVPPKKEDGVILVFDAAKSNPDLVVDAAASFASLGVAHDRAVQQGAGDLLRLVVGVTIGKMEAAELRGQAYEKEYARRINWCLDDGRGYEYVECDLSPEAITQGHDARDKDGFARVIEAISGTMWSSAVMNKSKKTVLKKSYKEETAQMERESEYVPPDPSMLLGSSNDDDEAREEQARRSILEQSGIEQEAQGVQLSGQENVNPAEEESQQQRQREQERMFDNLESALRQAASIREMSRAGDMSDDDRRKRAGDAADLLMTLMQQVGMDDESSEEEEAEPQSTEN